MNFASVAVKNVGRNMFRASLTILGVAVAMLAFVLLRTVLWAWTIGERVRGEGSRGDAPQDHVRDVDAAALRRRHPQHARA